jgi:HlyD family secretion protein
MVDIPRKSQARKRLIRRIIGGVLVIAIGAAITWKLGKLQPAAPSVDRATVWIDTVKRGPMVRNVRGIGTLVPEEITWVPSVTEGRVERRLVQPGERVQPDTILMDLSNPQLQNDTVNAEWDLKAAESSSTDLRVRLETGELTQEVDMAKLESDYTQAKLKADADEELVKQSLLPELTFKLDKVTAEQLAGRIVMEKKRNEINKESIKAQLAVQQVKVDQLRAIYALKKSQLEQLRVRAGVTGVLQLLSVEVGQRVAPGTNLARVSNPRKLKAELKIAETQAKDVQVGQVASIDTRNGIIPGRVSRKDPSAQGGTVTVDVALLGALPTGAVPDLSVDGTVEFEHLENVVYVGRPVQGQADSTLGLFKLVEGGKEAVRIQVKLGRASVNTIEIVDGLKPGDQVILSDMSAQDGYDRIRLN